MEKRGENSFRWPSDQDMFHYSQQDIVCKIDPPEPSPFRPWYRGGVMYELDSKVLEKIISKFNAYKLDNGN